MSKPSVPPLPAWEQRTCWVVGVTAILYGIYRQYLTSLHLKSSLQYLDVGWDFLGGKQDVGDYEWAIYSSHLCWRLVPVIGLHIITSRILSRLAVQPKTRQLVYMATGATMICYLQSWCFLLLLVLTAVVFFLVSTLHSLLAVWSMALFFVHACNSHSQTLMDVLEISTSEDYFVVMYIWASVFLRCTCYAIERVWSLNVHTAKSSPVASSASSSLASKSATEAELTAEVVKDLNGSKLSFSNAETSLFVKQKHPCKRISSQTSAEKQNGCIVTSKDSLLYKWPVLSKVPDFCDALVYVFYVPMLFNGPPLAFKTFKEQIEKPEPVSKECCINIAWKFLTICLWFCFNTILFHLLFFAACGEEPALLHEADKWAIITTAYLIGQFMTNKYVVIYGAMKHTARLDGLQLADNPTCISYVYAYSDMWKSFDPGLYDCLKRYIYIPLGGSQAGPLHTQTALLGTFCFMGLWHGGGYRYMMWALLNFIELGMEHIGTSLERSLLVQKYMLNRLSAAGVRRVKAVLFYPLFVLSTISNMFFLAGPPFAHLYTATVCLHWDSFLTFGVVVYCMIQNAKHLERLGLTKLSKCRSAA